MTLLSHLHLGVKQFFSSIPYFRIVAAGKQRFVTGRAVPALSKNSPETKLLITNVETMSLYESRFTKEVPI